MKIIYSIIVWIAIIIYLYIMINYLPEKISYILN